MAVFKKINAGGRPGISRSKDPLHGITLEMILNSLVEKLGWEEMGLRVKIRCFTDNPSISSSLKFLRKTPWAREKVEQLYLRRERGQVSF
jgi:uncharacterized protein (DUF2132 family)